MEVKAFVNTGDLEVSVINNVSISDLVLRYGSDHQVVSGTKILRGGLHVYGDIIASTVNGIDFWNLNNSLVIMDNDVTFTAPVTFENLVTCLVKVDVTDRVNGLDMLQLSRDIVTVKEKISNQYHKIDLLLRQFGSLNEENYMNARELYAELSYLERMEFPRDTEVYGELWVGHIATEGEDLFLKIISCPNPPCGCDTECHYYKVKGNGWLEPVAQLSIKVDVVNHPLNDQHFVAIYSRCENGQPIARVDIDYYLGTSPIATYDVMGMVSGTGLFIINEMNYLVVMLQVVDGKDATEKTVIFVLKLDAVGKRIINTWSREFTKKAAGMDLALIDNTWFLLVASNYDPMDKVTPYTVTSELFIWEMSSEMFTMVGEYVADHTSSGMFLTVDMPVGESFFTLAQLKEADSVYFPDNVKYTAQVLVFRYNKVNKNFEAFQSLAAFGVVDQTLLVVDNSVYLLLVSTVHNCLYVFEYYHPEGFMLVYKIYVENPYSLIILEVEDCTLVAVSTSNGLVRFKVHIKGVDPDSLLIKI
ncbi:hypothetical protein Hamer_G020822 [Homarus americanus]|uniref:Uncharacterized protein n=1 Tax=Homarus americanus TaxID=6706 RepID=A0A8J5JTD6_HOMAM|nr:hypothetical protein Hamer_G020822 [Homarus americanus]